MNNGQLIKHVLEKYRLEKNEMQGKHVDLESNLKAFFTKHNKADVFEHTLDVVDVLRSLQQYHVFDFEKVKVGALCHDIGRVVDKNEILDLCLDFDHTLNPGEVEVPSLLHQIASRILSEHVFGITDNEIFNAIECHTTLKPQASMIDKLIFVSDKLSWKSPEHSELVNTMQRLSTRSLDETVYHYLKNLYENRHRVAYYHKWSEQAYFYFKDRITVDK